MTRHSRGETLLTGILFIGVVAVILFVSVGYQLKYSHWARIKRMEVQVEQLQEDIQELIDARLPSDTQGPDGGAEEGTLRQAAGNAQKGEG